jgi:starvation-inducible DNA-binding protein
MSTLNWIGLDQDSSQALVGQLNQLLADYQVFYMNARGFHWNIRGSQFFELHLKFEELYNDLLLKVDEVAERILTLGGVPQHDFASYLEDSRIAPVKNATDAVSTIDSVLKSLQSLLVSQRQLQKVAAEAGDDGTASLMSDYIKVQEKMVWMYASYQS